MELVVFLGAGASYGSRGIVPYNPPLGRNLYEELERMYPSEFEAISKAIGRENISDFEAKMHHISDSKKFNMVVLNAMIAVYFSKFRAVKNSTYEQLILTIEEGTNDYILSTLNYDCLIESAATHLGKTVNYKPPRNIYSLNILKLHGSCNFYFNVVKGPLGAMRAPPENGLISAPVSFIPNLDQVPTQLKQCPFGPCMSYYMNGKPTTAGKNFLNRLQQYWEDQIKNAQKLLIIGVNPHFPDTHIWIPITTTKANIGYIGRKKAYQTLKNAASNTEHIADDFSNSIPATKTFLKQY